MAYDHGFKHVVLDTQQDFLVTFWCIMEDIACDTKMTK